MQMQKRAGKALVIFLVMMAVLTCFGHALNELAVPIVTTVGSQRGALEYRVSADGTIEAAKALPVMANAEALVTEILVKQGQQVEAGAPLLSMDYQKIMADRHEKLIDAIDKYASERQAFQWAKADISTDSLDTLASRRKSLDTAETKRDDAQKELSDIEADPESTELQIRRAKSKLSTAQDNVDYYKRRLEQMTSAREYMRAQKAMGTAQEALDRAWRDYFSAYSQLDGAQQINQQKLREAAIRKVDYGSSATELIPHNYAAVYPATLRAPAAGEVLSISAKLGENLTTAAPALILSDAQRGLTLRATISVDDAKLMQVGDIAEVRIDEEYVNCQIIAIGAAAETSGKYDIELSVPEGKGAIGLRGLMQFVGKSAQYDVLIPLSALREDGNGSFAYVVETREGALGESLYVRRVDVNVLDKDQSRAAIQSGITMRDALVQRSERELSDGDRVRLKEGG